MILSTSSLIPVNKKQNQSRIQKQKKIKIKFYFIFLATDTTKRLFSFAAFQSEFEASPSTSNVARLYQNSRLKNSFQPLKVAFELVRYKFVKRNRNIPRAYLLTVSIWVYEIKKVAKCKFVFQNT